LVLLPCAGLYKCIEWRCLQKKITTSFFFLQFIWVGEESQLLKDSSEEVRLTYWKLQCWNSLDRVLEPIQLKTPLYFIQPNITRNRSS
jgi:hypothetical protein